MAKEKHTKNKNIVSTPKVVIPEIERLNNEKLEKLSQEELVKLGEKYGIFGERKELIKDILRFQFTIKWQ